MSVPASCDTSRFLRSAREWQPDRSCSGRAYAEKALSRGHQIFVQVKDEAAATALHDSLWTFREASFLPHAIAGTDDGEPLVIGWDDPPTEHDDVLINTTGVVPGHFARFGRLAEIVAPDAATLEASREAWRFIGTGATPLPNMICRSTDYCLQGTSTS